MTPNIRGGFRDYQPNERTVTRLMEEARAAGVMLPIETARHLARIAIVEEGPEIVGAVRELLQTALQELDAEIEVAPNAPRAVRSYELSPAPASAPPPAPLAEPADLTALVRERLGEAAEPGDKRGGKRALFGERPGPPPAARQDETDEQRPIFRGRRRP